MSANAQRRFFFSHVMKTGGTSLVFQMLANFAPSEVYPDEAHDRRSRSDAEPYASLANLERLTPERRSEIHVYTGHLPFAARELIASDVVTLTLLRDPVERTISVLKHFKRLYERFHDLPLAEIYDDEFVFRHFVENFQTRMFALTLADAPRAFASSIDFRSMRAALELPAGVRVVPDGNDTIRIDDERLAMARANLARVDVLGVNETYARFVDELRHRFGWNIGETDVAPRANVSSEPWPADDPLRARVARDNRFDLELYEYAKELIAG